MKRRTAVIVLGLGAVAVLSLVAIRGLGGSERHGDGDGPLGSNGVPIGEGMRVNPTVGPTTWTYGVPLCLVSGDQPAILESVGPTVSVGSGYQVLGTGVREFDATPDHNGIISVDPWPPPTAQVPDPISPVAGFAVSTPCTHGAFGPATELLVGLAVTSADGGGWQGIEVSYTAGGRHHVLVLNHDLMICGQSVDCSLPTGS